MRSQLILIFLIAVSSLSSWASTSSVPWRIIIANDTCPDVTWGFTEEQTRQALADLVRAHLDEMNRTDDRSTENRDHFNLATTQEALDFVQRYPARKDEFIRRLRQGRICMSPFLCNSLWGFQSVEGAIRTLYPARRLEREWGVPIDVAEHIELPSLPWGQASLLAGCGIRWISVPFLDYDCTWKNLKVPPLFYWAGPDGSEVKVLLDAWSSLRANYAQGAYLLKDPKRISTDWIPYFKQLGKTYPITVVFASGTHSDISPQSWKQVQGFCEAVERYNNAIAPSEPHFVNGALAQFCAEADAAEQFTPFMPRLSGCFGHSWELWPVSLAHTVAALRGGERAFLAAESLAALACHAHPEFSENTRFEREQAEWLWAMLSDHAWNGTDLKNKRHNADLRRIWAEKFTRIGQALTERSWQQFGFKPDANSITIFNPVGFANDILVLCDAPSQVNEVQYARRTVPAQFFLDSDKRRIAFVATKVPAFGFSEYQLVSGTTPNSQSSSFSFSNSTLDGPFYRLRIDSSSGGLASLVHKQSGQELLSANTGRALMQTVYFDGREHVLSNAQFQQIENGNVFARIHITGNMNAIEVANWITLYAALDRIDFDVQIRKPAVTNLNRLLHFFPVGHGTRDLHIETTAAVLRPYLQPDGDLLPGADTRRFAVQGFVDSSPAGAAGVTIAPWDAFMLRMDQDAPAFEALGNDQNWKEVIQDQDGMQHFRFRYSVRAHATGFDNASALAWSRAVTAPTIITPGRIDRTWLNQSWLEVDPKNALVTCFKPGYGLQSKHVVVRVWETAGKSGNVILDAPRYSEAQRMDLLEREGSILPWKNQRTAVDIRPHGFASVKLKL